MKITTLREALVCLALLGASGSQAAERFTANTLRLSQNEASPQATIAAMAWLQGLWSGAGLGGEIQEIWSAPRAGAMMGMYRLLAGERPVFYEFITLREINGSLELRIKHFDAELRGWEERHESLSFPLVAIRAGQIYFEGLTFEPRQDTLTIYLAIRDRDGSVREEIFRYKRGA